MRMWGVVLVAVLLVSAACGDGEESSTSSPTAGAPSATAGAVTPTAAPATAEATAQAGDFRAFAAEIDAAAGRRDTAWFQERALTTHVVCDETNTPAQLGGPACDTIGQEFEGFTLGGWRSEFAVVPAENVTESFDRLFKGALAAETDEFGDGAPGVYAISDDGATGAAVIAAIVERPPDFAGEGPLRVALNTSWTVTDGEWLMDELIIAYVLAEDFLLPNPEVADSYLPNWERY